jgi:hypothetical protein
VVEDFSEVETVFNELDKELCARRGRVVARARAELQRRPLKSKKEEDEFMFDRGFDFAVASLRTVREAKGKLGVSQDSLVSATKLDTAVL